MFIFMLNDIKMDMEMDTDADTDIEIGTSKC